MDEMKASGLLDRRPAIETLPQADLFTGQKKVDGVEGLSVGVDSDDASYDDDYDFTPNDAREEELEGV